MNAGVIIFVLLLVLAFLGLPIYLSIGIATMVAMLHAGFPLEAVAQKTFLGMNSSSLLCIPLFILAGNIMAQGITQKLINAANVPLGRVRGSLASVTVLSSALFGAISGSAVATVAAVGGMTVPAMVKEGYDKNYAVACASCSSLLGPMIPPSISLVVYASLTECSIQKLFMATAIPAVFCAVCFLAYTLYYGWKMKLPQQPKATMKEKLYILKDSIWALFMPIIVLGLIFGGICTVSEAAGLGLLGSGQNGHNKLEVLDVERADGVVAGLSVLEHLFGGNKCHERLLLSLARIWTSGVRVRKAFYLAFCCPHCMEIVRVTCMRYHRNAGQDTRF